MSIPEPNEEGETFLPISRRGEVVVDGRGVKLRNEGLMGQQRVGQHARVLVHVQKPFFQTGLKKSK